MQRSTISSSVKVRCGMPALARGAADQLDDLGIGRGLALLVVAEPAAAGLLPDPAQLVQLVGDQRPALARLAEVLRAPGGPARRRRGRPCRPRRRCPSPCRSRSARGRPARASRLPRPGTAPRTCRGTSCGCRRSPRQLPTTTGTLPSRLAKASAVASTSGLVARAADDFDQPHHVRRAEEVQADDVLAGGEVTAAIASMSSVEVLVASTAPGLAARVELAEHLLLERHVLEHRFDDQVGVGRRRRRRAAVRQSRRAARAAASAVRRPRFTDAS